MAPQRDPLRTTNSQVCSRSSQPPRVPVGVRVYRTGDRGRDTTGVAGEREVGQEEPQGAGLNSSGPRSGGESPGSYPVGRDRVNDNQPQRLRSDLAPDHGGPSRLGSFRSASSELPLANAVDPLDQLIGSLPWHDISDRYIFQICKRRPSLGPG